MVAGLFVHEDTCGVVPFFIMGRVKVKVILVPGQNSVVSTGEMVCPKVHRPVPTRAAASRTFLCI
jgi:hypothetical protein